MDTSDPSIRSKENPNDNRALVQTLSTSENKTYNSDTTNDNFIRKRPKMTNLEKGNKISPTSRDTRGGTKTNQKEEDDVADISRILLGESKGDISLRSCPSV